MRKLLWLFVVLCALCAIVWGSAEVAFRITNPEPPFVLTESVLVEVNDSASVRWGGNGWYRKNEFGLWEAYVEGAPFERGQTLGLLAQNEVRSQEAHFIAQIKNLVPSAWLLKTLRYGVAIFNRNLNNHVMPELQREIWGVAQAFDPANNWVGPPYARVMNYHAAHDIGHALQDLSIVGCTSFAAWGDASADSRLIIGRNFDFYMGDDFARDKMLLFVQPDSGYAFASITWAGFMGVVSGMNSQGLTVTLNAAKSSIPTGSKTPISLLAREILQYATTIDEAVAIAKSRQTFVSESILIGSANDKRAVIIEKSPDTMGVYQPNGHRLVCANHFQSDAFASDSVNIRFRDQSDSPYRFARMNQLLDSLHTIDFLSAAEVLRERNDLNGTDIGLGNPRSINQLIAHHGVIFLPEKRLMWVSTQPYQMGRMVCYDLNKVFSKSIVPPGPMHEVDFTIPPDPFVSTQSFSAYETWRENRQNLIAHTLFGKPIQWEEADNERFISSNPNNYLTYLYLGDLYSKRGDKERAINYYTTSLGKAVASKSEEESIKKRLGEME